MKTTAFLLLSSLLILNVQAQTVPQNAQSEQKQLKVFVGDWKYKGVNYATPLGKAGEFTGMIKNRLILNGFFLECRWKDKGDYGDDKGIITEGVEIYGYDPVKGNYTLVSFEGDGASSTGVMTITGYTWKILGPRTGIDGKTYQIRSIYTFSKDGQRCTYKADMSSDGKNWLPWIELTNTKIRGTP